jgi:uncharacterized protein (DUF1501 family)
VRVRVHDNKSPSALTDWQSVTLHWAGAEATGSAAMRWYGEYLWTAAVPAGVGAGTLSIEAVDRAGNSTRGDAVEVETRIRSYEKAARMQLAVPELSDISKEPNEVLKRYGANPKQPSFANNCLLARRLLERGVCFVQLLDRGWDHHGGMPDVMERKTKQTDRPTAALLDDLAARGLLDDTLVVFAGEFGRTPYCEGAFSRKSYGRDHNNRVGSLWMAGGGIAGGTSFGKTDDRGWDTAENPVHVNDIQATILHTLGVDHLKLTRRFQGRDFRLTDVQGRVVSEILS